MMLFFKDKMDNSTESKLFWTGTSYIPQKSLEERIKEARAKIKKMSDEERRQLAREAFGMWSNYPEDWLQRMREGRIFDPNTTESCWIIFDSTRNK